jgi:hypothetical protein
MATHESYYITYSLFAEHPVLQTIRETTAEKIVEFAFFLAYAEY